MGWSWEALGKRPIFFPVGALVLGCWVGPLAPLPPEVAWLGVGLCLVSSALLAPRTGALLLLLAGSFWVGVAGAACEDDAGPPSMGHHLLEAEVDQVVSGVDGDDDWLVLSVARTDAMPGRYRVGLTGGAADLLPGQRILLRARLRPISRAGNEGEADRSELRRRQRLRASGVFEAASVVRLTPAPAWRLWLTRAHGALAAQAAVSVADPDARALVLTLAAGLRAGLGEELEESFARSGLAHVLSVSGLHVAVVAMATFAALRWALSRRMRRWNRGLDARAFAALPAIALVWAYVLYTGLQAPAVRSGVMSSLVLSGWLVGRRSDALNALAFALLVMTAVEPTTPFELSVQLSFVAVLAMVLGPPTLRAAVPLPPPAPARETGWRLRASVWREAALQTAIASTAVTCATAPIILAAFQRVSIAGVLSNIVTLPLSGLLTMASASAAAVHLVWPWAGGLLLTAAGLLARAFLWIAARFAELPLAAVSLPAPSPPLAASWWLGLAAIVFLRGPWRWLGLLSPAAVVALIVTASPGTGRVEVTFLAVGHGDSVVVGSAGHFAVIDGGGVPEGADLGRRVVLPFLRQRMARSLDLVVLTHAHPDHALGLVSTLEELPARRLWLPAGITSGPLVDDVLAAAGDAQVEGVEVGDEGLSVGEARLEVLGPPVDRSHLASENDRSLVLRVRHGAVTFLLTGDVEAAAERFLNPGAVTVMKAPHHGSTTSSTPWLLEQARPRHVVFCVGRHNRFGFPRKEVVARYEALGARCYRTDLDGAVTFHSNGEEVSVETFLPP